MFAVVYAMSAGEFFLSTGELLCLQENFWFDAYVLEVERDLVRFLIDLMNFFPESSS